jgi:hypothetical protein
LTTPYLGSAAIDLGTKNTSELAANRTGFIGDRQPSGFPVFSITCCKSRRSAPGQQGSGQMPCAVTEERGTCLDGFDVRGWNQLMGVALPVTEDQEPAGTAFDKRTGTRSQSCWVGIATSDKTATEVPRTLLVVIAHPVDSLFYH